MTPVVFKAFLQHAESKKIKLNWTIVQINGSSFLKKKSEHFISITITTGNTSCIRTYVSQYTMKHHQSLYSSLANFV